MPSTKDFSFDDLGDVQVTLGHDDYDWTNR